MSTTRNRSESLEAAEFDRVCDLYAAKGSPRLLLPASSTSHAIRLACEFYTSLEENAPVQMFTTPSQRFDPFAVFQPNVRRCVVVTCVQEDDDETMRVNFKRALELLERIDAELHVTDLASFAPTTRESIVRDLTVVQRASRILVFLDEEFRENRVMSSSPRLNALIAYALVLRKRVNLCYRNSWMEFQLENDNEMRKFSVESPRIDGKRETMAIFDSDELAEETVPYLTNVFLDAF